MYDKFIEKENFFSVSIYECEKKNHFAFIKCCAYVVSAFMFFVIVLPVRNILPRCHVTPIVFGDKICRKN